MVKITGVAEPYWMITDAANKRTMSFDRQVVFFKQIRVTDVGTEMMRHTKFEKIAATTMRLLKVLISNF